MLSKGSHSPTCFGVCPQLEKADSNHISNFSFQGPRNRGSRLKREPVNSQICTFCTRLLIISMLYGDFHTNPDFKSGPTSKATNTFPRGRSFTSQGSLLADHQDSQEGTYLIHANLVPCPRLDITDRRIFAYIALCLVCTSGTCTMCILAATCNLPRSMVFFSVLCIGFLFQVSSSLVSFLILNPFNAKGTFLLLCPRCLPPLASQACNQPPMHLCSLLLQRTVIQLRSWLRFSWFREQCRAIAYVRFPKRLTTCSKFRW